VTPAEKDHIVAAFRFELGKVNAMPVRVTAVAQLNEVDHDLAAQVAAGVEVSADHGLVVSSLAKDDVPDRFTEELATALSRHRDYDRTVDHISA